MGICQRLAASTVQHLKRIDAWAALRRICAGVLSSALSDGVTLRGDWLNMEM